MTLQFENKVVLITGAGSGIGRATAFAFAERGAKVVVSDINEAGGAETVRLISDAGGRAVFVQADVTSSADVQNLVKQTVETFGRLDIAFNNAGISGLQGATADCSEENWHQVLVVDLTGVFLCLKYEIQQMLAQGSGVVVNMSSLAGIVGTAFGVPAYVAAKHGVVGLTKAAALEYAKKGIRVNAVCPAYTDTPLLEAGLNFSANFKEHVASRQPVGRLGRPEEVAGAVLWLCSDEATFVTGIAMPIDGGGSAC